MCMYVYIDILLLRRGVWSKRFVTWFLKIFRRQQNTHWDGPTMLESSRTTVFATTWRDMKQTAIFQTKINKMIKNVGIQITLSEDDWGVTITSWAKYLGFHLPFSEGDWIRRESSWSWELFQKSVEFFGGDWKTWLSYLCFFCDLSQLDHYVASFTKLRSQQRFKLSWALDEVSSAPLADTIGHNFIISNHDRLYDTRGHWTIPRVITNILSLLLRGSRYA